MSDSAADGRRTLALDSSVVMDWVLQEPSWRVVQRLVASDRVNLVLPGPVLTEVIATAHRKGNVSTPAKLHLALAAAGMRPEPPVVQDLQAAAELLITSRANVEQRDGKGHTLSLGDSLVLAVTGRLGCPIVTRDQHWTWLAGQGLLKVRVHQI